MTSRSTWLNLEMDDPVAEAYQGGELIPVSEETANLIGSDLGNGTHLPVLDIDFPCRLVPSSTPGHFHLYLDGMEPLAWQDYKALLLSLAKAGVIDQGYFVASVMRGMTLVRKPGVFKPSSR